MARILSALLVLLFVAVGCGTKQNNLQQGCNVTNVQKDRMVYFIGYKDETKFKSGVDYVGKVLNVLADGYAEVEWANAAGPGRTSVSSSSVKAENDCAPARVGKRVFFVGYKDEKTFKTGTDYFGNIANTFSNDFYYIKWDAFKDEIHVHSGSSLKIQE